mmetsp:Transcript_27958/g.64755  ORF Transcript_27958/g.64755 Transcript_27958/m.64755 type:complete len:234 (-) Transcript_27958:431-1132(-)
MTLFMSHTYAPKSLAPVVPPRSPTLLPWPFPSQANASFSMAPTEEAQRLATPSVNTHTPLVSPTLSPPQTSITPMNAAEPTPHPNSQAPVDSSTTLHPSRTTQNPSVGPTDGEPTSIPTTYRLPSSIPPTKHFPSSNPSPSPSTEPSAWATLVPTNSVRVNRVPTIHPLSANPSQSTAPTSKGKGKGPTPKSCPGGCGTEAVCRGDFGCQPRCDHPNGCTKGFVCMQDGFCDQ